MDPVELRTPDPETIEVLDFDFVLDGGIPLELTLRKEDTITTAGEVMTIEVAATGEIFDIPLAKILFTRKVARQVQVDRPAPAASAAIPPTAVSQPQPVIDSLQSLPD